MATKKSEVKTFSATGTFKNVQISVELNALDLAGAVEEAKKLKFSDFITPEGDIFDYDGPEITSVWEN